jgi:cytochrome d ubiquinol oxidase subunit I
VIPDFTPQAWMSFVLLGLATVAHLFLVNIVLGLAVLVPSFEAIGARKHDPDVDRVSRRLFRYMIVSDLFAGVWATWLVVILGTLWPTLAFTVTRVLFIPLLIGLLGVVVSIPAIVLYWYTWDRVSRRIHLAIGALMAVGAALVPTGFNVIFSFINFPAGLSEAEAGDLYAVFSNPVYWAFTPHRFFGALTLIGLTVAGVYGYKYARGSDPERGALFKGFRYSLYFGLVALAVEAVLGVEFALTLQTYSPYLFETVLGGLFGAGIETYYRFLPLFAVFIGLVAVMGVGGVALLRSSRRGGVSMYTSLGVALSALVALPLIEFIHDASRGPYMIIQGDTGIHANSLVNPFIRIGWELGFLTIGVAAFLALLFAAFLYVGFVRGPR